MVEKVQGAHSVVTIFFTGGLEGGGVLFNVSESKFFHYKEEMSSDFTKTLEKIPTIEIKSRKISEMKKLGRGDFLIKHECL